MEQVIDHFKETIEYEKNYTLKELQSLLETSYKKFIKTKGASKTSETKKLPSPYNLFIKDTIAKMKQEKIEGIDPKDFMKIAAKKWQENKLKVETSDA